MVQGNVWLWVFYIFQKYTLIFIILVWSLLKKIKDQTHNLQNRKSCEMANRIFETYKNSTMPHVHHRYKTVSGMTMATMCAYPSYQHTLQHWKYVYMCVFGFHDG